MPVWSSTQPNSTVSIPRILPSARPDSLLYDGVIRSHSGNRVVNAREIKIAGHLIEEAVDATAAAIHESPTATKLLEASGLHMPHLPAISAPSILGERIGTLLTNDRVKAFAEDLFGQLEKRPSVDFELEDRMNAAGWKQSRKQAIAEHAISKAGIQTGSLHEIADTRSLYESLKGAPTARTALTKFVTAREEYNTVTAAYNKAVIGPRFADTYGATNRLVDNSGLVKPRLKVSNALAGADASYSDFALNYPTSAFDGSAVSLVKASAHELTHLEQHQLQILLKADELGVGAQATPQQIQKISDWFKASGNETSESAIKRALELRAGRFLTDEAAERAHATIQSNHEIANLWDSNFPHRQRLAQLRHFEARASYGGDTQNIALELAHPQTGLILSNELFGSTQGAQMFAKYAQKASIAERFATLPRQQKAAFSSELIADLNNSIEDAHDKLKPYFAAYEAARHETEAFANGSFAASFHPQNYIFKGDF